jgi:hypothetical protein
MEYGAFDDKYAFGEVKKLIEKFKVKRIYETGTYLGWSSSKLSEFDLPVVTIESNSNYLNEIKNNLKYKKNIKIFLGESHEILNLLCTENEENSLFFLDAHWGEELPIFDELNVIKRTKNPIIIIHDFFVPGGNKKRGKDTNGYYIVDDLSGSKFGFDSYNGITLDFDYIKNKIEEIYPNGYDYHYTSEIDCVDSGLIYIYPKINKIN